MKEDLVLYFSWDCDIWLEIPDPLFLNLTRFHSNVVAATDVTLLALAGIGLRHQKVHPRFRY